MSRLKSLALTAMAVLVLFAGPATVSAVNISNPICATGGFRITIQETTGAATCYEVDFTGGPGSCNQNNLPCPTTVCLAAFGQATFTIPWTGANCPPGTGTYTNAIVVTNCSSGADTASISISCP